MTDTNGGLELYPGQQLSEPIEDVLRKFYLNAERQMDLYRDILFARWDQNSKERIRDEGAQVTHKQADLLLKFFGVTKAWSNDQRCCSVLMMARLLHYLENPGDYKSESPRRKRTTTMPAFILARPRPTRDK